MCGKLLSTFLVETSFCGGGLSIGMLVRQRVCNNSEMAAHLFYSYESHIECTMFVPTYRDRNNGLNNTGNNLTIPSLFVCKLTPCNPTLSLVKSETFQNVLMFSVEVAGLVEYLLFRPPQCLLTNIYCTRSLPLFLSWSLKLYGSAKKR